MCDGPLGPEDLSQQLDVSDGSLSYRVYTVAQPGDANSIELLYKEYFS